jgi:hypothetical protein
MRPTVAKAIIEQQLSPQAIARMFSVAAGKQSGKVAAIVLLAGSTKVQCSPPRLGWRHLGARPCLADAQGCQL